jgi:ankyrin repeat protein
MAKDTRSLDELLQAVADILYPGEDVPPRITLDSADCDGDTPLHVYLWRKDDWAARFLIEHGANVNTVGDMGETPLHVAMRHAEARTIAALLTAGAHTEIVSEFDQTPLQLAQLAKREEVYREAQRLARDTKRSKRLPPSEA